MLVLLWLLVVGTVAQEELIAAAAAAAVGATAGHVARRLGVLRVRLDANLAARLWRPLLRVLPEFVEVLWALGRRRGGVFRTLEFPTGGERRGDYGRRAFVGYAGSLAPARLVVDVDAESGTVLVHDLGGSGSADLP